MRIRKIAVYVAAGYFFSMGIACNSSVKEKESCKLEDSLNPNGTSELALLMREMALHAETNHNLLIAGKSIAAKPEDIGTIMTAERTKKDLDTVLFKGFAKIYLQRLKELDEAPENNKITAHNALVTSCTDCHSNMCPGPIKRINKLFITP